MGKIKDEAIDQRNDQQSPFKILEQNLPFHNFEDIPVFTGIYKNTIVLGEDKETQFSANIFVNLDTGEENFVADSYSINKAIRKAKEENESGLHDLVFKIEFLGKTEIKGKPFNQFIISYCTLDEYELFDKGLKIPIPKEK